MFLKLRQRFFESFEATYSFAKNLYQRMGKNKQHWQVSNAAKGMQIILQDLRLIWQYDADDNRYITFIARSINRINIILQRFQSGKFKELFTELYNQLLKLLPTGVNIQLSLFDFHAAFGFSSSSSFAALRPFESIKDFLRSATWTTSSSSFKSYQGKQLNLSQA